MAFQSNAWQNNAFQEGPGTTDNPPSGKPDYLPYSPSQIYEWLPRWWLIPSSRQVGFPDVNPNPPFPGATALAALSLLVSTAWVAADPLPQLPRNVAATIPAAVVPYVPVGAQVQQAILNNWLPADQGPVLDSNAQPYQPRNMTPPISAQLPSGAVGSVVQPDAVNQWWSLPPPGPTFGPDLQPYQPTRLVPPISQQKPATVNGTFVPDAVQQWWSVPRLELILGPDLQAYQPTRIVPPISQQLPAATRGSVVQNDAVHQWWNIPPPGPTIDINQQPYGPINSTPPVSQQLPVSTRGPVTQPDAVNQWWNVPAPPSQQGPNLVQPSPVAAYLPIGTAVPAPVQIQWTTPPAYGFPFEVVPLLTPPSSSTIPPGRFDFIVVEPSSQLYPWQPPWWLVQRVLGSSQQGAPPPPPPPPQNPPFPGAAAFDLSEIIETWIPPDPQPITVRNLVPPVSGPVPQNPPSAGGSSRQIDPAILAYWNRPVAMVDLQLANAVSAQPQPSVGAAMPLAVLVSWIPAQPDLLLPTPRRSPPTAGPVPQNPPVHGTRVPVEVHVSWLPPDPQPIVGPKIPPGTIPPSPPPPVRGAPTPLEVLIGWIPPPPQPITGPQRVPGAASQPTVKGAPVPVEVLIGWIPPPPDPIMGMGRVGTLEGTKLAPPQSGVVGQNPPFPGTKVSTEVLVSWIPPPPPPIVGQQAFRAGAQPSQPPVKGSPVSLEVLVGWIPPPPLPALWPPFNASLAPLPAKTPYVRYQVETYVAWIPPDPAFQTVRVNPPPPAPSRPPSIGTPVTVPYPIRSWWDLPPPDPLKAKNLAVTPSGPVPQNPPFMGGARVSFAVLIYWIPPDPQPITLGLPIPSGQPILFVDTRFITYPQPRVTVTSDPRTQVTYGQSRSEIFTPLRSGSPHANDLSLIDATEVTNDVFDFGSWLSVGTSIASIVSTSCVVLSGTDPSPSSRLIGPSSIVTSPRTGLAAQAVLQRAGQMVAGVLYRLTATVKTSNGQTLTLYGHQLCDVGELQTANLPPALDFSRPEDSQYLGSFFG